MSEPRLRLLLRRAEKVADAGKRAAAESLYRQIIEESPGSVQGWLGLAGVLSEKAEKVAAYEKVLSLDPDNEPASTKLARIKGQQPQSGDDHIVSRPKRDEASGHSPDWHSDGTGRQGENAISAAHSREAAKKEPLVYQEHAHGAEPAEEEAHGRVCYRHPNRETSLRCYSCDRPICSQCAVKTPVGYRCPTCIREAEDVFFNAKLTDYVIAPLISMPLSLIAGYLVLQFSGGFFFILIMLFAGGAVGSLIGRLAKRAIGRRRGRYLPHIVAGTVVLGVAIPILLLMLLGLRVSLGILLLPGIYALVATSSAFYQMK